MIFGAACVHPLQVKRSQRAAFLCARRRYNICFDNTESSRLIVAALYDRDDKTEKGLSDLTDEIVRTV